MIKNIITYLIPLCFILNVSAGDLEKGHEAMKQGDFNSAFTHYSKACDDNDLKACGAVGVMYERELGRKQDYKKALEIYNRVCDGGEMIGCGMLAMHYADGKIIKQDLPKAIDLYEKACNGNHAKSCFNLGMLYYQGKGVEKSSAQAKIFFKKACETGFADGCTNVKFLDSENIPEKTNDKDTNTDTKNIEKSEETPSDQVSKTPQNTKESEESEEYDTDQISTPSQNDSDTQFVIDSTTADKVNDLINTAKHSYTGNNATIIGEFKTLETLDDQFQRAVSQSEQPTVLNELMIQVNDQVTKVVMALKDDPSQAQASSTSLKEIISLIADK